MIKKGFFLLFGLILLSTQTFAIEIEQGAHFLVNDAVSAIVSDTGIVDVVTQNNRVELKAIGVGKTSLFVWSQTGVMTVLPISVISPDAVALKKNLLNMNTAKLKSSDSQNIKVNFSARGGFGSSQSNLESNQYTYRWDTEQFGVSGETDFGKLDSLFQIERRDYLSQAVIMFVKLESDRYLAQVGDNWVAFSPIVGSSIRYQGVQLSNVYIKGTKIDLFAGSTGMAYWGNDVDRSNSLKTGFLGIRTFGKIDKNLSLAGSIYTASQFNQPQILAGSATQRFNLYSLQGFYDYGAVRIESEFAQSAASKSGHHALLVYTQPTFRYQIKYLSVDPEFKTISDIYNSAGINGVFQDFTFAYSDAISFFGQYNGYSLQTISSGGISDISFGTDIRFSGYPQLRISASRWDHRSLPYGEVDNAFSVYSSYLVKSDHIRIFGQYTPVSFATPSSNTAVSGINHRLRIGVETDTHPFVLSNELGFDSKSLDLQSNYDRNYSNKVKFSIYPITVIKWGDSTLQLMADTSLTRVIYRNSSPESYFTNQVRFSLLNWLGDELYAQYLIDNSLTPSGNRSADSQHLEFGINHTFDTDIRLVSNKKFIRGLIFDDTNGNGFRDSGELGIEGIGIGSDSQILQTDANGEFNIAYENSDLISIDASASPVAKVNFQNPFSVHQTSDKVEESVLIPVTFEKEYPIITYLDGNNNSQYDENSDPLITHSVIKVTDKEGNTYPFISETGKISVTLDAHKDKTYMVAIDLNSISSDLVPLLAEPVFNSVPSDPAGRSIFYFGFRPKL